MLKKSANKSDLTAVILDLDTGFMGHQSPLLEKVAALAAKAAWIADQVRNDSK